MKLSCQQFAFSRSCFLSLQGKSHQSVEGMETLWLGFLYWSWSFWMKTKPQIPTGTLPCWVRITVQSSHSRIVFIRSHLFVCGRLGYVQHSRTDGGKLAANETKRIVWNLTEGEQEEKIRHCYALPPLSCRRHAWRIFLSIAFRWSSLLIPWFHTHWLPRFTLISIICNFTCFLHAFYMHIHADPRRQALRAWGSFSISQPLSFIQLVEKPWNEKLFNSLLPSLFWPIMPCFDSTLHSWASFISHVCSNRWQKRTCAPWCSETTWTRTWNPRSESTRRWSP